MNDKKDNDLQLFILQLVKSIQYIKNENSNNK